MSQVEMICIDVFIPDTRNVEQLNITHVPPIITDAGEKYIGDKAKDLLEHITQLHDLRLRVLRNKMRKFIETNYARIHDFLYSPPNGLIAS